MRRYISKAILPILSIFIIGSISSEVKAEESVPLFGPETYTRTTGQPNRFERSFPLPTGVGAPFTVKVINGDPDGKKRISSASILLNGVEVVKESDFNQKTAIIERSVSLSTENKLIVELRSGPGGRISVEISGVGLAPQIKKTIGPQGGTIELQGTINSVKMEIPSGALASDTEITIRQMPTPTPDRFWGKRSLPIGNTFSFEPHGLSFLKVVTVSFTYQDEDVPQGGNEGQIAVYIEDPDSRFRAEGGAICPVNEEGEEQISPNCISTESTANFIDTDTNIAGVWINRLSLRGLAIRMSADIIGCNGVDEEIATLETLSADGFNLPVLRCLSRRMELLCESHGIASHSSIAPKMNTVRVLVIKICKGPRDKDESHIFASSQAK